MIREAKRKIFLVQEKSKVKNSATNNSASDDSLRLPYWTSFIYVFSIVWNDPEAWGKNLVINLILNPLHFLMSLSENLWKFCLQHRQARAQQGSRICLLISPFSHELCLVFPVQFQQNQNVYKGLDMDTMKDFKRLCFLWVYRYIL